MKSNSKIFQIITMNSKKLYNDLISSFDDPHKKPQQIPHHTLEINSNLHWTKVYYRPLRLIILARASDAFSKGQNSTLVKAT